MKLKIKDLIYGVPRPGSSTGGRRLFSKKIGGAKIFYRKKNRETFLRSIKDSEDFRKDKGGKDFLTKKFENPRFRFQKAIYEGQVI